MAVKTMRVRAVAKGFGGTPPARRVPGEVFDVAATRQLKVFSEPDAHGRQKVLETKTVKNTANWYEEVEPQTPAGRPARRQEPTPDLVRKDGNYVPSKQLGISGGGDPLVVKAPPADGVRGEDLAG